MAEDTPLITINRGINESNGIHGMLWSVASGRVGKLICVGIANVLVALNIGLLFAWTGAEQNSKNTQGYSFDPKDGRFFNLHKLFMVFGLCILPANGFLIYRYNFLRLPRLLFKITHAIVMLASIGFGIAGLGIVVKQLETWQTKHFTDLHGWFGLLTLVVFLAQWVVGLVTFLLPLGIKKSLKEVIMRFHRFIGMMLIMLPTITALMGIYSFKSKQYYSELNYLGEFLGCFLFIQGVFVSFLLYGPGNLILQSSDGTKNENKPGGRGLK